MSASYDVGCFELAVAFILDEPDVELAHAGPLAARIQRTIEEYLSEVRDNAASKKAFDSAKARDCLCRYATTTFAVDSIHAKQCRLYDAQAEAVAEASDAALLRDAVASGRDPAKTQADVQRLLRDAASKVGRGVKP